MMQVDSSGIAEPRSVLASRAVQASLWRCSLLALASLHLPAPGAHAMDVEVAPFVGAQFGGWFDSAATGRTTTLGSGLVYGATVDVPVAQGWLVELMYSRQETELSGGRTASAFDLSVERYMAGIQEEKVLDWGRFFGVFLVGLTRFAPGLGGFDVDERFTLGLSLGLKASLSKRLGLRGEARGFFVAVESGGGILCSNGSCLFRYSASGLWQGDVTAAVVIAF